MQWERKETKEAGLALGRKGLPGKAVSRNLYLPGSVSLS